MPHRSSDSFEMPPASCPNGGICIAIIPRLENIEQNVSKLEANCGTYTKEQEFQNIAIKSLQIIQQERDQVFDFIKKVFIAILVAVVMQVGTTIWWAAKLQSAIDTAASLIDDHETRIRVNESVLYGYPKPGPSKGR